MFMLATVAETFSSVTKLLLEGEMGVGDEHFAGTASIMCDNHHPVGSMGSMGSPYYHQDFYGMDFQVATYLYYLHVLDNYFSL